MCSCGEGSRPHEGLFLTLNSYEELALLFSPAPFLWERQICGVLKDSVCLFMHSIKVFDQ